VSGGGGDILLQWPHGEEGGRRISAYAPALLPGCAPLRYVYKVRCNLDHLLAEAVPDSTPTRYTLRIKGVTVRYFPASKVVIIFAKTPSEAEAVATQCRPL